MITQNFIYILRDIMQRAGARYGAYPLVDGPTNTFYTTQIAQDEQDSQYIGNDYRVQIGDGYTPATRNDYKLEHQLLTGFTQSIVYSHAIDNDGDHVLIMDVTIANTGSDALTIREIGYTIPTRVAATQGGVPLESTILIVLVDRTVLDTPVTIEPNETKTIRYTLKTVENIVSEHANLQSKTATQNGTVMPDQGYDGLSSVTVNVSGGGAGFTHITTESTYPVRVFTTTATGGLNI